MVLVISQGSFAFIVQQIEKGFQLNFVTESMHIKKEKEPTLLQTNKDHLYSTQSKLFKCSVYHIYIMKCGG